MKRLLPSALALACGAALHAAPPELVPQPSLESLSMRQTAWGVLPTYDVDGHYFTFVRMPRPSVVSPTAKPVTVDVVVEADGSVSDATVVISSGDKTTDFAVLASFIGARYSLQPGADYPTPFVVKQKITFTRQAMRVSTFDNIAYNGFSRGPSMPGPGSPFNSAWMGSR